MTLPTMTKLWAVLDNNGKIISESIREKAEDSAHDMTVSISDVVKITVYYLKKE